MTLTPFPYQEKAIQELRSGVAQCRKRQILCMLMGAGKTLVALEMMRVCSDKGLRCLFLCDRRMLADQAVGRAIDQGLDAGIIMAGRGRDLDKPCQFASKQTMESWIKRGHLDLPDFALGIIDECHRGLEYQKKLFERMPNTVWVGLSATPCDAKGRGLGAYYQGLVQPITVSELKKMGRIVGVRAFAPHIPKLDGVKIKNGDYDRKGLSKLMNRKNLVADTVGWWKTHGQGRPSVYFGCDKAHALAMRDEFRVAGIPAEMIIDETPDNERDEIRHALKTGRISVVVNCDTLTEGVDWPFVSCIGMVRPTKSLRRYLQATGRGMRADEGKEDMILIDHAGCVLYHGMPDREFLWSVSPTDVATPVKAKDPELRTFCCRNCKALFSGSKACPECGTPLRDHELKPITQDNRSTTLVEVTGRETLGPELDALEHKRFWGTCVGKAIKMNAKAGMAAGMFARKFGIPPWEAGLQNLPFGEDWKRPAREIFANYIRSKQPA